MLHSPYLMLEKVLKAALVCLMATAMLLPYPVKYVSNIPPLGQSGYESLAIAESLARGNGFSDPYWLHATGPSALVPPAFPAFLALLISGPAAMRQHSF